MERGPLINGLSRRGFVQGMGMVGLGIVAGCGPWPGQASSTGHVPQRVYRVGHLTSAGTSGDGIWDALRELGYIEGQNLHIEIRRQLGTGEAAPHARELSELP